MPTFSTLPIGEARARSATGKRAALLQEYVGYVERVAPGEAGKLEAGEGETTQAIRRRLNAAATALGKNLESGARRIRSTSGRRTDGGEAGRARTRWSRRRTSALL